MTRTRSIALIGGFALALSACGGTSAGSGEETTDSAATVEVEDNNGTQTVPSPPTSVVATDNRTFETLDEWGIELSAAAVSLMPGSVSYTEDDSIVDLGLHVEPDLEAVVAADPDVIVNGQRFTQFHDKFAELVPEATILELDPREGEPFDEELTRQTSVLGEVFDKQDEADQLIADFEESVERAKGAYDSEDTVMAVISSGGDFGYVAPGSGRTLGPVFDILGLEPSLSVDDTSSNDQGDDISVEAIAESDPDWLLVMDRDAAIAPDEEGFKPAEKLIRGNEALADVTAVTEDNVVIMPTDTYLNEGIQTYTEFFNAFADELEAAN